jgi:hypothetical protein
MEMARSLLKSMQVPSRFWGGGNETLCVFVEQAANQSFGR